MKAVTALLASLFFAISVWAAEPVNVNTASAEQIAENLKGIGLSKAQAIVAYREANGAFLDVDELVNVKGIGIRTVDQNRGLILVSDSEADPAE